MDKIKLTMVRKGKTLLGYRATYHGKKALAIMNTGQHGELICKDYIFLDDLFGELNSGPSIVLEKYIKE